MFGSVYESKDGQNVIKEGKLSPKELSILVNSRTSKHSLTSSTLQSFLTIRDHADEIFGSSFDSENEDMGDRKGYFNQSHLPMVRWLCQSWVVSPSQGWLETWHGWGPEGTVRPEVVGVHVRKQIAQTWKSPSQRHAWWELLCGWTR